MVVTEALVAGAARDRGRGRRRARRPWGGPPRGRAGPARPRRTTPAALAAGARARGSPTPSCAPAAAGAALRRRKTLPDWLETATVHRGVLAVAGPDPRRTVMPVRRTEADGA